MPNVLVRDVPDDVAVHSADLVELVRATVVLCADLLARRSDG
jgi:hypothetical protein